MLLFFSYEKDCLSKVWTRNRFATLISKKKKELNCLFIESFAVCFRSLQSRNFWQNCEWLCPNCTGFGNTCRNQRSRYKSCFVKGKQTQVYKVMVVYDYVYIVVSVWCIYMSSSIVWKDIYITKKIVNCTPFYRGTFQPISWPAGKTQVSSYWILKIITKQPKNSK